MSLEDRLRSGIADAVDSAVLGRGHVGAAAARGRRQRRLRHSALVAGGAGSVVAVVAVVAAVTSTDPARTGPDEPAGPDPIGNGGWTRAAAAPLSPRYGPLMISVDDRVLVMGGHDSPPCPPGADCVTPDDGLADAAAYDVDGDRWLDVSDAPFEVDRFTPAVVVDDVVVIAAGDRWVTYSPGTDEWTDLPGPGLESDGPQATADGLVYARGSDRARDVLVLDLAARSWSTLPRDPLTPRLTGTSIFATDAGIVVAGVNYQEAAPDEPTLTQADLWDGETWTRLPRTGQIGPLYHWTGERLVGLEPGGADGGEVNGWDRGYPAGGSLDPSTGAWAPVPGLPTGYGPTSEGSWLVEAADGPLVATSGRVYDDRTQTWTDLGRPDSPVDSELTAAWDDGLLVVFGGHDEDDRRDGETGLSAETWVWSPGSVQASDPAAPETDDGNGDAVPAPTGDPAVWTLPDSTTAGPTTTSLTVDVSRLGCNSGVTGEVLAPTIDYGDTEVHVTFLVEAGAGAGTCQSNRPVSVDLVLEEPLGDRTLVDGACLPGGAAATTTWCDPDGVRSGPARP